MKEQCCICLRENKDLISIFNESFDQLYSALTSIEVSTDNELPNKMCLNCAKELREIQSFKQLCLESHRIATESEDALISIVEVKEEEFEDYKEKIEVLHVKSATEEDPTKPDVKAKKKGKKNEGTRIILYCPHSPCKRMFYKQAPLDNHVKTHTGEEPNTCDICGQAFAIYANLRRHLYIHEGIKKYPCRHCEKSFRSSHGRSIHENSIHTKAKTYICPICGQSFYNMIQEANHRKRHEAVKQYQCNECGKMFKSKVELKCHCISHFGVRKFNCNICETKFLRNYDLKNHIKYVHNPTRDFHCNECDKTYKKKGQLEEHLRSHTGEKPFVCEVCDKAFATITVLKRHAFIHTGNRRYSCTKCSSSYAESYRLKKHIEREHPD